MHDTPLTNEATTEPRTETIPEPKQKYYLTRLPGTFFLITTNNKDLLLKPILNCLLADGLFSITQESDGSCSIIAQLKSEDDLDSVLRTGESYLSPDKYCGLQINTLNPALNESGMLAEVTSFFARHDISILCLSTFNCNYVYYPVDQEERLLQAVKAADGLFELEELG